MNQNVAGTYRRIIAIGDIHGCASALDRLLLAIAPGPEDVVITLGDCLDWGPASQEVIARLLQLQEQTQLVSLLGNHEEMLFAALEQKSELGSWLRFGGDATLASYGIERPQDLPREHLQFLRKFRTYWETERFVFVHANYFPNLPLDQQPHSALLWEHLDLEEAAPHYSGKTFVVGHTPQPDGDVLDLGFLLGIDTDAARGGWLTAVDVASGAIWQTNESRALRTTTRASGAR